MNFVGRLQTQFTNVEVRGFADNMPGFLGNWQSSVAVGSLKKVQLDANAALKPQARVMHELGHIAEYVTKPWNVASDATWNGGAANAWTYTSGEYGHFAYNEAWASHYGNITFWYDNAVTPTTCNSVGTCYSAGVPLANTNIEATSWPAGFNNCSSLAAAPEQRWPLSLMRYLWDVYDNRNDSVGDEYSANQGDFWRHMSNSFYYPNGVGTNQIDEPWAPPAAAGIWVLTEPDGRGAVSSKANYASVRDTETLRLRNCAPF